MEKLDGKPYAKMEEDNSNPRRGPVPQGRRREFWLPGWTSIVPTNTGNSLTGILSYSSATGRAVFSVATDPSTASLIV